MDAPAISDIAYAAGIIDGEGCITITKAKPSALRRTINPQYQLSIAVVMADPEVPKWLYSKWPGGLTILNAPKYNKNAKPTFSWTLRAEKACAFLRLIFPFLKIKHRQALIGIKFQSTCIQRIGTRIRAQDGTFAKGNELQSSVSINKKEAMKSLISRFNQGSGIWSGSLAGYPRPERYSQFKEAADGKHN